jgi:hypothetical protein
MAAPTIAIGRLYDKYEFADAFFAGNEVCLRNMNIKNWVWRFR